MVAAEVESRFPDSRGDGSERRGILVPEGLLARHPGPSWGEAVSCDSSSVCQEHHSCPLEKCDYSVLGESGAPTQEWLSFPAAQQGEPSQVPAMGESAFSDLILLESVFAQPGTCRMEERAQLSPWSFQPDQAC